MPERVRFLIDPRCPWCYQTARWMRRLEELGEVTVTWAVFSLSIAHQGDGAAPDRDAAAFFRTLIAVRREHGSSAAGRFYFGVADAVHQQRRSADDHEVLENALEGAGIDGAVLREALQDESTWTAVRDEHAAAVQELEAFGVPTIVLEESGGSIFGPVISGVPADDEARELWAHVRWLLANRNFAEMKRGRMQLQIAGRREKDTAAASGEHRAA